jgi:hypothetical protein
MVSATATALASNARRLKMPLNRLLGSSGMPSVFSYKDKLMAHSSILQDQLPANRALGFADALNPAQEKRKAVSVEFWPDPAV